MTEILRPTACPVVTPFNSHFRRGNAVQQDAAFLGIRAL